MKIISYLLGLMLVASPALATTAKTTSKVPKVTLTKDNTLVMNDYFEGETVAQVEQTAKELDAKIPTGEPVYLVIDSGGGSIEAGIELIENLNTLNRPVRTVTLFSASMGFQTVQGIKGSRLVLENGTLMSHKARGGFFGEFPGQLDSRYAHYLKRVQRLDKKAVERTKGKQTDKSYAASIQNEMWCDGAECVSKGYADLVVTAACDQSLKGSHIRTADRFLYMGHTVEIIEVMSNCPLVTSPLNWNIIVDGQPLFSTDAAAVLAPVKKVDTSTSPYVYSSSYNDAVVKTLGVETTENIKKLVNEKLDANKGYNKRIIRYY